MVRHGLANLYRPGNPSAALLAALGLGVMLMMTVYFVQQAAVRELHITTAAKLPNMFLIDIAASEVDGVRALLAAAARASRASRKLSPSSASRLIAVNGVAFADLKLRAYPAPVRGVARIRAAARAMSAQPQPHVRPNAGRAAARRQDHRRQVVDSRRKLQNRREHPLVAIGKFQAQRLGVHPGQHDHHRRAGRRRLQRPLPLSIEAD